MKRQQIAAVACLMAGAIGFVGVYSSEKAQSKRQEQELAQVEEQENPISETSIVVEPKQEETEETEQKEVTNEDSAKETMSVKEEAKADVEKAVQTAPVEPALHFAQDEKMSWPLKGEVLLPYCMDSTIYFPTLEQYQYNPAMIIQGDVNSKVFFAAKGKIKDISTNEETGCTVTQDLGDGYTAVYGQLKEVNFKVGDTVEAGQVVGYVSEPTKYYSVEGSNLYFSMQKDDKPIDPTEFLETE